MKTKNFSLLLLLALCFSILLGACSTPAAPAPTVAPTATSTPEAQPITLTDGLGRSITLAEPAQRIVSLAPSNTEILFAIGAGSQVVGRETFSDYPSEAQSLADVGGSYGELNTELIVSLKPDLLLAADITPPEQIQALQDLGLTVFALGNPTTLEGMYENLLTVARLTGRQKEAEALVSSLKARVADVESKLVGVSQRPLVFYELDATEPNAPYTAGPGTFVDTLIQMAGGQNLGSSLEGAWVQVSLEKLVELQPQIIILGDYTWGGVTPEQVAARPGWETLSAVQNNQVYTFDDNTVSRPGPRMVDGLEAMARLLHPELFK